MSGFVKVHAGRSGNGSRPLCGGGTRRTSGVSMSVTGFLAEAVEARCKRCDAKVAERHARFGQASS